MLVASSFGTIRQSAVKLRGQATEWLGAKWGSTGDLASPVAASLKEDQGVARLRRISGTRPSKPVPRSISDDGSSIGVLATDQTPGDPLS